jgi:hypothetical protein
MGLLGYFSFPEILAIMVSWSYLAGHWWRVGVLLAIICEICLELKKSIYCIFDIESVA